MSLKASVRRAVALSGYRISRTQRGGWPLDFRPDEIRIVEGVQPYTMTSPERVKAMIDATRYVVRAGVPGAIVEGGVWRGGSMMAAALALSDLDAVRELVLCDVFDAPMPNPTGHDRTVTGDVAQAGGERYWNFVTTDEVHRNMATTAYRGPVRLVPGRVEDTLPAAAPAEIALLRLDTDWYESTLHELRTLYPRLAVGGVLIVDDYGSHEGVRRAVDEFFANNPPFLARIDIGAAVATKR